MHRQLVPVNAEAVRKRLHRYVKAARRRGAVGGLQPNRMPRLGVIPPYSVDPSLEIVAASLSVQQSFLGNHLIARRVGSSEF